MGICGSLRYTAKAANYRSAGSCPLGPRPRPARPHLHPIYPRACPGRRCGSSPPPRQVPRENTQRLSKQLGRLLLALWTCCWTANRARERTSAWRRCSSLRLRLRELIASPSASRTVGHTSNWTANRKSRTILRRTATWAASFCPKKARSGRKILSSFATTGGHPAKVARARCSVQPIAQAGHFDERAGAAGYISWTEGAKTTSTPAASSVRQSCFQGSGIAGEVFFGSKLGGVYEN